MDFEFNEDQLVMRETAARVFTDMCADDKVKELTNNGAATTLHTALWQQLADLGILGLPFTEQYGGMDMSLLEFCLVLEEQGRTVAPVPLISTVVESAMTIAAGDNEQLKQTLIPKVISGELILSAVSTYTGLQDFVALTAKQNGNELVLSGRSSFASYAGLANGFVVAASDREGQHVIAYVAKDTPGLRIIEQVAINDESAGYIIFDNSNITADNIIASGARATALIDQQQQRTWVAHAALQVGLLDEGLKRAAVYVSERKQFGRPLGAFQAVGQQAANAYMENESLRSAYWRALDDIEQGNDGAMSAMVAKFWVGEAAHKSAHIFLHIHGGIGQDLDYPIHRYFLWAKQIERYLGSPEKMAVKIGDLFVDNLDAYLGAA
ncbi:MAG: alkylation response protein AidB-like acyl-CoA dehydrogenase [Arenicella sp.]|jgi:alkylation response protein AidB-like acyl-CoA dehydrogenase